MRIKNLKSLLIITLVGTLALVITSCSDSIKAPDEYKYDDLTEYITVGNYKGIEYSNSEISVSDQEIKDYINKELENHKETRKVESGTATNDCIVNIDYVGSVDGKEFEGGSAKGTDLDIANSNFIAGFAEGIVGHSVGETFDLHVTFPENYGEASLAGKAAVFKTTINYISQKVLPEYNNDFVKQYSSFKTTAEYEKNIYDALYDEKKEEALSSQRNDVFEKIKSASKVKKYPEKEYKARCDQITNSYKAQAANSGMKVDEFITSSLGITQEEFNKKVKETARDAVKSELILHQIARLEKIEAGDAEYNEYIEKLLKDAGITAADFKKNNGISIAQYAEDNNLFTAMLYQTVMDKVMKYSVAK